MLSGEKRSASRSTLRMPLTHGATSGCGVVDFRQGCGSGQAKIWRFNCQACAFAASPSACACRSGPLRWSPSVDACGLAMPSRAHTRVRTCWRTLRCVRRNFSSRCAAALPIGGKHASGWWTYPPYVCCCPTTPERSSQPGPDICGMRFPNVASASWCALRMAFNRKRRM